VLGVQLCVITPGLTPLVLDSLKAHTWEEDSGQMADYKALGISFPHDKNGLRKLFLWNSDVY
jgi:hypothetical protein